MGKRIDLAGQKFGRLTVLEDVGRRGGGVLWKCLCECGNIVSVRSNCLRNGETQSCGCWYKINLTGQKFGGLIVLEDVGRTKQGSVVWKCLCECGNTTNVTTGHLQNGATQSCGCLRRAITSQRSYLNLVGQKFGRLTVLEDVGRTKGKKVIWRCLCDCGNAVDVSSVSLRSGNTQSCGCYMRDRITEMNKKDLVGQKFGLLTVLEDVGRQNREVLWRCLCDCGNIVDVLSGNLQKGNTKSCGCYNKERHSGENHPNWKGGITPLTKAVRMCTRYKVWRHTICQRDNFTCVHCQVNGVKLIVHHITRFSKIIKENHITTLEEAIQCEALWDVSNGLTLCKKCHKKLHKTLNKSQIIM
jgi:hypothetical protein